ncbi:tripartite tricarboxylate transporter TctB family protein [Pseudooceanicola algae]|uniref:DUF1468 domain-containing protein n=1 Tax=Pseudooceanicola algae TaxID=1537215 RepID=A0A418SHP0_9RHOB|nr:tripartite tricarboxylate transporter TctB family protein [Pseudooceanicola algae]QPM90276.1 hypothetical protein PSAL_015110 [Pseudooceanicola algae]
MSKANRRPVPGVDIPPRPGQRFGTRFQTLIRTRTLQDLFQRHGRAGEAVFAAAFFALSLLLLILLPWQTQWVPRTKLYVQPAFWPAIALFVMLVFSGGYLVVALGSHRLPGLRAELGAWARAGEFMVWFIAYVWLVPVIGYLLATIAFCCTLSWRMGYRNARWMGLSALFGLAVVALFKGFLGVNIPAGDIYDLLPPGEARSFLMTNF